MITIPVNTAWFAANSIKQYRFKTAVTNPQKVQELILQKLISNNINTSYGTQYKFSNINTVKKYQDAVPLAEYEHYSKYIEQIIEGKEGVLTEEPVIRLMPSSGSAGNIKYIPYTKTLQQQFNCAIAPWVNNLFTRYPDLFAGKSYWSITPQLETSHYPPSKVPIGFEKDTSYLGGGIKKLIESTMTMNSSVCKIVDIENFKYITLLSLLNCINLRLISIWHPSYLTLLLKSADKYWDRLIHDLKTGDINPPGPIASELKSHFKRKSNKKRAGFLRAIGSDNYQNFWPKLTLISCWGSNHAANAINELKGLFPDVMIQEKGLISTEAFVSIPMCNDTKNHTYHPLTINSHFYEFIHEDGNIYLSHELKEGEEYSVVITTGGGLYRYQLNDRIRVNGFYRQTPSITFIGKIDSISDLCGEKLHDHFVAKVLNSVLKKYQKSIYFSMLAPEIHSGSSFYTLFIEYKDQIPDVLVNELDLKLSENPHYRHCRNLNQLDRPKIFRIAHSGHDIYIKNKQKSISNMGNIKPTKLSTNQGWSSIFDGEFI